MLQASKRSYVCWRCALGTSRTGRLDARPTASLVARGTPNAPLTGRVRHQPPKTRLHGTHANRHSQGFATVQSERGNSSASRDAHKRPEKRLPIRERLRIWEREHPAAAQSMLTDSPEEGELSNSFTRPQNVAMAQFDASAPLFQGDELGELRADGSLLTPGDLVELRYTPSHTQPVVNTSNM